MLLGTFPHEHIERQLTWLPYRRARNPVAFLLSAIEHNYDPPLGVPRIPARSSRATGEPTDGGRGGNADALEAGAFGPAAGEGEGAESSHPGSNPAGAQGKAEQILELQLPPDGDAPKTNA